ncbi:MAG: class I SAM-dependent methyltransferase [Caldilineaceae bacterium]
MCAGGASSRSGVAAGRTVSRWRQGAHVTGVDLSDAQIDFARHLAHEEGVAVDFRQGEAADLGFVATDSLDWLLAVYLFPYVEDVLAVLRACTRTLKPGGRLVLSQDHPIRACFWDQDAEDEGVLPTRRYFDTGPMRWSFADTGAPMRTYHRPLAQWLDWIGEAGLIFHRLLEFSIPPDWADDPWADEYTRDVAVHLPQTMILIAEKPD